MKLTNAKLLANLMNAQLSTGPRTEAGKKRASLNALKHGCSAQTIILPGEDTQHFSKLHFELKKSLQPANFHEETLVETLAHTQWAINRMRAHENNLFAVGHIQLGDTVDNDDSTIQAALVAVKTMKRELDAIGTISLYLQRNVRMYQTTLAQLISLQATRKAEEQKDLALMTRLAMHHHAAKAEFQPEFFGSVCSPEKLERLIRIEKAWKSPKTQTNAA